MSLVFAAITPHSPSSLLAVEPTNARLQSVQSALKDLEGELYVMQPDTLFVISPQAMMEPEAFSVNLAPDFNCIVPSYSQELPPLKLHGDVELVSKMREYAGSYGVTVHTITQPDVDQATAVALRHLTQHLPTVKVVPISLASASIENHYKFGNALRSVALQTNKRVAVIAAAELGHALSADAATGYHPAAEAFDKTVLQAIEAGTLTDLVQINPTLAEQAQSLNEFKTLVVLAGALADAKLQSRVITYQAVNGSGLLVAQFSLI